jgi:cation transport ATPase
MQLPTVSFSSVSSSNETNVEEEGLTVSAAYYYPFTRQEECSWHPEEAGRKLSQLLSIASDIKSLMNGTSYSYHHSSSAKTHLEHELNNQHLMSRGWTATQARYLRSIFGTNVIHGDEDGEDEVIKILNIIPIPKCFCKVLGRISPWWVPICSGFISQFNEPLNIMLLVSAAISLILKQISDAVSIGLALTIVSLVAAIQEYRSEAALEKLNDLVPHTCTIMRDGAVRDHYPAKHLVVGDLIILSTGDRIPADCRIVDAIELTVDESSLTGENRPVSKIGDAVPFSANTKDPPLTDQKNIAFMGTLVCSGRARALVVAVGNRTEFGKVASELGKVESRKSPLQVKIDELGKTLAFISSLVIAIMALLGWFLGRPFLETVTVAVSLAVAAIPEGMCVCMMHICKIPSIYVIP